MQIEPSSADCCTAERLGEHACDGPRPPGNCLATVQSGASDIQSCTGLVSPVFGRLDRCLLGRVETQNTKKKESETPTESSGLKVLRLRLVPVLGATLLSVPGCAARQMHRHWPFLISAATAAGQNVTVR